MQRKFPFLVLFQNLTQPPRSIQEDVSRYPFNLSLHSTVSPRFVSVVWSYFCVYECLPTCMNGNHVYAVPVEVEDAVGLQGTGAADSGESPGLRTVVLGSSSRSVPERNS